MSSATLSFNEPDAVRQLFGERNRNLGIIEAAMEVKIGLRGTEATVSGAEADVEVTTSTLRQLYEIIRSGHPVYPSDIQFALKIVSRSPSANLKDIFLDKILITCDRGIVAPKSLVQKSYIEAIRNHDIVFGIGPAGTGKTYLAVAMATAALNSGEVKKIILARPAVEAGERLGFLPGDMAQKINPYLRPLYDALYSMLGKEKTGELIEQETIEIAPLAFMRGRTLNDAFIILDEAQNTTREQMKMFLTRMGFNSRAVVTGDITQIDLPESSLSGLIHATKILSNIKGIEFCRFTEADVVRHPLVQKIIVAYEKKKIAHGRPPEK